MNSSVEQSRITNAANAWTVAITRLVILKQNNPFAIFAVGLDLKDEIIKSILVAVDYPHKREANLQKAEIIQRELDAYLTDKELS